MSTNNKIIVHTMFLTQNNPIYNTIIVFTVVMLIIYVSKPDVIYDHKRNEFKHFGTGEGKTLVPIYVISIILAIILYMFFHHISSTEEKTNIIKEVKEIEKTDGNVQLQQQIHQLQTQLNQMLQNQINVLQLQQTEMTAKALPNMFDLM